MPKEPDKEILKVGDILAWLPGITSYQIDQLVDAGTLNPLPYGKHRRFYKEHVRQVLTNSTTTT